MKQLYLYVEGQTEQTFADTVLGPHLLKFNVYLMGSVLAQVGRSRGKTYRGGVLKYSPCKNGLQNLFKQHDRVGVYFSTMIDFYKLPRDFPQPDHMPDDPIEQVRSFENAFALDLKHPTFIPYIQLHEYEAILFTKPDEFELFYHDQPDALKSLQKIADEFPNPELINKGEDTAPSKRILEVLPSYQKRLHGPQVAELIGLDTIRKKCPHFSEWVSRLEQIGS
jgi:Domain of unknown function (DUF4276)